MSAGYKSCEKITLLGKNESVTTSGKHKPRVNSVAVYAKRVPDFEVVEVVASDEDGIILSGEVKRTKEISIRSVRHKAYYIKS